MSLRGYKALTDSPGAAQECPLPSLQQLTLCCSLVDFKLRGNIHTEVKQLLLPFLATTGVQSLPLFPKKLPAFHPCTHLSSTCQAPTRFPPHHTASGTRHGLMICSGKSSHLMDGGLPHQAHPGAATATSKVSSMFKPCTAHRRVGAQHLV